MLDLLKLSAYKYELDESLIAQTPSEKREMSRLLILDKTTGNIDHRHFFNIIDYLNPGDCLVINNTRVIPARLFGKNPTRAGIIEVVLLERDKDSDDETWICMTKPGKKTHPGDKIIFEKDDKKMTGTVLSVLDGGLRRIKFEYEGIFNELLDALGLMPLPPYITKTLSDKDRYQTVYAKYDGSAAAPTAGLHFSKELIEQLKAKSVFFAQVLLHVGICTFRPVKVDDITKHHMHNEHIEVDEIAADTINNARANGGRIICVGTTSCRTLESVADDNGFIKPFKGETGIFIYPSYKFKVMDGLITNFHLPESTLLMLVSAFGGYDNVMNAYENAVTDKYRFFSFGDAMLLI